MSARVLIHVGTAKTGTTSIQQALARGEATGIIRPACYPTPDGRINHFHLASLYLPYARSARVLKSRYPKQDRTLLALQRRYRRSLFRRLSASPVAILSTEQFTLLGTAEITSLRKDLEDAGFSEFHVVLYVRDPADYYLSDAQQRLKASANLKDPVRFKYPFASIAGQWEEAFPGSLVVRRFSRDGGFDVVDDFSRVLSERLGVSLPPAAIHLNESMSAEGMAIVQRYRALFWKDRDDVFTNDTNRLVRFLTSSLTTVPQTRAELKPSVASWIRFTHRDDAAGLRERFGVDLGLGDAGPCEPPRPPDDGVWRVADIVRHVDGETIDTLLLHYAGWTPPRNAAPRSRGARLREWVLRRLRPDWRF